jgi:hypothetical protein
MGIRKRTRTAAAVGLLAGVMLTTGTPTQVALATVGQRPCGANALCANAPGPDAVTRPPRSARSSTATSRSKSDARRPWRPTRCPSPGIPRASPPGSAALASFTMPTRRWGANIAPNMSAVDGTSSTCTADGDGLLAGPRRQRSGPTYPRDNKFNSIRVPLETARRSSRPPLGAARPKHAGGATIIAVNRTRSAC